MSSLRTGVMAGSPCPIEVMRQVIDRLGAREITIGYGLTEASPIITQSRNTDPIELRVETVGRLLPGVEVKIVDPATGRTLGDNEQGELCARGHGIMLGYYNNPEATAAAIDADGWLHSGDLAVRLPNGYYRITGPDQGHGDPRRREHLSARDRGVSVHASGRRAGGRGGRARQEVRRRAVRVGQAQGRLHVHARTRSATSAARKLAHYKVPRYVKFVDAFPQTVTGKIQKFKIRELMIAEYKLEEQETA